MKEIKPIQKEYRIHCAIIKHLKSAWPRIIYTHAGKARDETHAHFLSEMGYKAGTGDIIWCCKGKFGEMEVKSEDGDQSDDQKTRQRGIEENGGIYCLVRSVRQAHDFFISLGFSPHHEAVKEPDLRSDMEKKRDAVSFYSPAAKLSDNQPLTRQSDKDAQDFRF